MSAVRRPSRSCYLPSNRLCELPDEHLVLDVFETEFPPRTLVGNWRTGFRKTHCVTHPQHLAEGSQWASVNTAASTSAFSESTPRNARRSTSADGRR